MSYTAAIRLFFVCLSVSLCACVSTPKHQIPVEPQFIRAGVVPGDEIEIVTVDGRALAFVVTEVDEDSIAGEEARVGFDEIDVLVKRSWRPPAHPCGAGREVGCSIPGLVQAIDETATARFHAACVQHDYCYRHGYATYGVDREACDERFHEQLQAECNKGKLLGVILPGSFAEHAKCLAIAESMYVAVRRYGEDAFLTSRSTHCPYDAK